MSTQDFVLRSRTLFSFRVGSSASLAPGRLVHRRLTESGREHRTHQTVGIGFPRGGYGYLPLGDAAFFPWTAGVALSGAGTHRAWVVYLIGIYETLRRERSPSKAAWT